MELAEYDQSVGGSDSDLFSAPAPEAIYNMHEICQFLFMAGNKPFQQKAWKFRSLFVAKCL